MNQPITTNPFVIMLINMTIVFAVLYGLSLIIRLIRYIDPTVKKQKPTPEPAAAMPVQSAPIAAPVVSEALKADDDLEIASVIAAALAVYGYQPHQIVSIRLAGGQSWAKAGRLEAINTRL